MKKKIFIKIPILLTLLISCNACNQSGLALTFESPKNEVSYDLFESKLYRARSECELYQNNDEFGDRTISFEYLSISNYKTIRNDEQIYEQYQSYYRHDSFDVDYDSMVAKEIKAYDSIDRGKAKTDGNWSKSESHLTETLYHQFSTIDSVKRFIAVNPAEKNYLIDKAYSSAYTPRSYFGKMVRNKAIDVLNYQEFQGLSKNSSNSKYYIDKKDTLFTFYTNYEFIQDNGDYERVATKAQLDLTDGKQYYRMSRHTETKTTYDSSSVSGKPGDILLSEYNVYYDGVIQTKRINIKEIDIDGYSKST